VPALPRPLGFQQQRNRLPPPAAFQCQLLLTSACKLTTPARATRPRRLLEESRSPASPVTMSLEITKLAIALSFTPKQIPSNVHHTLDLGQRDQVRDARMLVIISMRAVLTHTHRAARTGRGREVSQIHIPTLLPSVPTRRRTAILPTVASTQAAAVGPSIPDGQDDGLHLTHGRTLSTH
jgi:hypothetical protein